MKQIIPGSNDLKSGDRFCQSMIARNRLTILNHMFLKIKVKLFSFLLVFILFLLNFSNSKCHSIVWKKAFGGNQKDYRIAIGAEESLNIFCPFNNFKQ